jgi:hypothetical protein
MKAKHQFLIVIILLIIFILLVNAAPVAAGFAWVG